MTELRTEPGTVIAAAPDMLDPNFMHSVVLMLQHSEQGAYGLVINRPASVSIDKLMPDHALLARARFPVFAGGPVGLDTLQFVHRASAEIPGGIELGAGLFLGGDLDALAAYIDAHRDAAAENVRMIVGYSGWGAGQLDLELGTGSWLPAALQAEWLFDADPQGVWRRVIRSLGSETSGLEDLPPRVSWN
jgi:putative transcriptional regulator